MSTMVDCYFVLCHLQSVIPENSWFFACYFPEKQIVDDKEDYKLVVDYRQSGPKIVTSNILYVYQSTTKRSNQVLVIIKNNLFK